jgi:hypothetical protein
MRLSSAIVYAAAAFAPLATFLAVPFSSGEAFSTLAAVAVAAAWLASALYVVYVFRSPTVPREKRGLWVAVIVFGGLFALPFFWFWYVWQPARVSHT